jgi:hypothetical protein
MQQIMFTLLPEVKGLRKSIPRDGELYQVYINFNIDLQVWELMLVKP